MAETSFVNYSSLAKNIVRERDARSKLSKSVIPFGVTFLDDVFGGITQDDLFVIAARSGQGKSELAGNIAMNCALSGRKVFYFALEAAEFEIERRLLFKALSNRFYSDPNRVAGSPDFQDWILGRQDDIFESYYSEELSKLSGVENFLIRYRDADFRIEDFERNFVSEKDSDLIVLDHLHYFDFVERSENEAFKNIVKQIRTISMKYGKPVVLVSHVRKADRREKSLVPDQEDLHGSSDIFKIATRVVSIAPAFDVALDEPHLWATYMRPVKNRLSNARTRFVGLTAFNSRTNQYDKHYSVGRLSVDGSEFEPCGLMNAPGWAKHAKVKREKTWGKI